MPTKTTDMRIYALISAQGTACGETAISGTDYANEMMRARVEQAAARDRSNDAPIPGTWIDVTENEYIAQAFEEPKKD